MILLDVGVWLAAVWEGHIHHSRVASWFGRQSNGLVLCRITQMSLLRLISNRSVMNKDALSRAEAWQVIDQLRGDERLIWLDEPASLEAAWRAISAHDDRSHKLWTDDYLAAFAQAAGLRLATLDKECSRRYPSITTELIS